jgi:GAF domain-containing protein
MNESDPSPAERMAEQIKRLIQAIEASSYAVLPTSDLDLLHSVVEAAARILETEAASIALVDEENDELEFKVSFDKTSGHSVIGMRIPIDKGIAGQVAMTGQPIAVANVKQDTRFNRDFAESTGFVPNAILATPLLSGEKVIGVMEVLDKSDGSSFSLQDMELLGIFARQAAIAIHQSQLHTQIGEALAQGLKRLAETDAEGKPYLLLDAIDTSGKKAPDDLLELAVLFNDIAALGPAERRACIQVLEAFRQYRKSKPTYMF